MCLVFLYSALLFFAMKRENLFQLWYCGLLVTDCFVPFKILYWIIQIKVIIFVSSTFFPTKFLPPDLCTFQIFPEMLLPCLVQSSFSVPPKISPSSHNFPYPTLLKWSQWRLHKSPRLLVFLSRLGSKMDKPFYTKIKYLYRTVF